jgi:hypothetical protein
MARRRLCIGSAAFPNAGIIGFIGRPIDKTAQSEGSFKISGFEDECGYPQARQSCGPRLDSEFLSLARDEGVSRRPTSAHVVALYKPRKPAPPPPPKL